MNEIEIASLWIKLAPTMWTFFSAAVSAASAFRRHVSAEPISDRDSAVRTQRLAYHALCPNDKSGTQEATIFFLLSTRDVLDGRSEKTKIAWPKHEQPKANIAAS